MHQQFYKKTFPQIDNNTIINDNVQYHANARMNGIENVLKNLFNIQVSRSSRDYFDRNENNEIKSNQIDEFRSILRQIEVRKKFLEFKKISFSILIMSLLISILIVLKLYIDYDEKENIDLTENNYDRACLNLECKSIVKNVLDNLDQRIEPCDDFYQFSCGSWIKKYKTKLKNYSLNNFNRFKELSKHNLNFLRKILWNNNESITNDTQSAIFKVQKYMKVCFENSFANENNIGQFLNGIEGFLKEIGGWPLLPQTFNLKKWNLIETLITLQSYKIFPFFISMVVSDNKNSSLNRMIFMENRIKVIKNKHEMRNFINFVLQFAKEIKKSVFSEKKKKKFRKYAQYIYYFDLKLSEIHKSIQYWKSNHKNEYVSLDFEGLTKLFHCKSAKDNEISVEKYLKGVFKNFKNFDGKTDKYFVRTPTYFSKLCDLLAKTNKIILANYIGFYAINDLIPFMPAKFQILKKKLKSETEAKDEELFDQKSVLKVCIKRTDDAFGSVTGSLFLMHRNLTDMTVGAIKNMTQNLREVFIESIPSIEWMDEKTKQNAIEKAEHMNINIGFPKWILNQKKLNKEYKNVEITESSFLNELSIRHYIRRKVLKRITVPSKREEWNMEPLEVNAYYTQLKNSIGFPIGILSDPFYNNFALPSLNYGGIGMVIGHEITHAFDVTGRNYDAFGNIKNWWGNISTKHFKRKAECFNKQYSSYTVGKKKLNGYLTLDENIADNGGLKLAYKTYKKFQSKNEDKLSSSDYLIDDKLFFIGFAQSFCSISTRFYAENSIEIDPHTFAKYRVIGALSNSFEFSKTFNCPLNSPMNPPEKCRIW